MDRNELRSIGNWYLGREGLFYLPVDDRRARLRLHNPLQSTTYREFGNNSSNLQGKDEPTFGGHSSLYIRC